jgi:type IV pilus assembly protein PilP
MAVMRKLAAIFAVVLLASCGQSDVEQFVAATANSKGVVEPLPVLKKVTAYQYVSGNLKSPFGESVASYSAVGFDSSSDANYRDNIAGEYENPSSNLTSSYDPNTNAVSIPNNSINGAPVDNTLKVRPGEVVLLQSNPDGGRKKFYLEQFDLINLKYVGSIKFKNYFWALILDRDGNVHNLRIGDYLGQNSGKIKEILENKIIIRELRPNKSGQWNEFDVEIGLLVKTKVNDQDNAKEQSE